MAELKDIMAYFCKEYPYKGELSKARLTKMVYLADWLSAQRVGCQMTVIEWVYNHYGPYVHDVASEAKKSNDIFVINSTSNIFGSYMDLIKLKNKQYKIDLSADEKGIIDDVIAETKDKSWSDFISYVYGTIPIKKSNKYDNLDLVALAKKYKGYKSFFLAF